MVKIIKIIKRGYGKGLFGHVKFILNKLPNNFFVPARPYTGQIHTGTCGFTPRGRQLVISQGGKPEVMENHVTVMVERGNGDLECASVGTHAKRVFNNKTRQWETNELISQEDMKKNKVPQYSATANVEGIILPQEAIENKKKRRCRKSSGKSGVA